MRPFGAYRRLVQTALNVSSNVEIWPYPAYVSRVYTPSARPDGLKLNGDRVCALVSDAVRTFIGPSILGAFVTDTAIYTAHHRFTVRFSDP